MRFVNTNEWNFDRFCFNDKKHPSGRTKLANGGGKGKVLRSVVGKRLAHFTGYDRSKRGGPETMSPVSILDSYLAEGHSF